MKSMIYRFILVGVPPDQALLRWKIGPDMLIMDIKKEIQRFYKLGPVLAIQLLFKKKVLPDMSSLTSIDYNPKRDFIYIMAGQSGGSQ